MQLNRSEYIIKRADSIMRRAESRDPDRIAEEIGIFVRYAPFVKQKGVYKIIERNRFVFLKEDMDPLMRNIVLLHEIGHDTLHRREASQFQEFNLFDRKENRMEYEANLFAAQIMLPDEEVLDYIYQGYDAAQIAGFLNSDRNLVALKVSSLNMRGFQFKGVEHKNNFLK